MLENISRKTGVVDTLREIMSERADRERLLAWRYPWFNVAFNYLIALLVIALSVSLYGWGLDILTQRRADAQAAEAIAAYQAEQQAAESARLQEIAAREASEAAIIDREAKAVAKAFYGIRLFVDKYHYDASQLETYARCIFNRVDVGNGINSLETVVSREGQFLGYADGNPVLDNYYQLAKKFVTDWHNEDVKPCDFSYQWAELTDKGIYLVNEFGADGYARRWHA